jgi:ribonuclease D
MGRSYGVSFDRPGAGAGDEPTAPMTAQGCQDSGIERWWTGAGDEMTDAGDVRWIGDDHALTELVKILLDEPAYGLDTEFLAERTYWPRLCLVQVSWPTGIALVDPMACDVRALGTVLDQPATMITHAGASDLPILERAVGARPAGLFDVQLAAGFVGLGTPSLSSLVSVLLGVRLDKSAQLTDWSARPLDASAREYAADDVAYLFPLALALRERLEALGREAWVSAECELMRTATPRVNDPETAWWRIKGATTMRGEKARIAQVVAAWRDRRAQRLDVPPRFVLSELALAAVVNQPPRNAAEVQQLRGVSGLPAGAIGELLDAIEAGRSMDHGRLRRPLKYDDVPELDAAVSLLSAWVTELATTERIDKKLLATRDDVKDLVYGRPSRLDHGWRAALCGQELRRVLAGEAVVRLVDGGRHLRLEGTS